jgi:AraC-like DNA-binding protein
MKSESWQFLELGGPADPADYRHALVAESPRRTLTLRIRSFIKTHLHEQDLNPGTIAARNHISVSYLHQLFQAAGTTVSAWIRQQRLERARRDLADPCLSTVPIHRIATHWGFADHSTFTRSFRAAYGIPPREYRRQNTSRTPPVSWV